MYHSVNQETGKDIQEDLLLNCLFSIKFCVPFVVLSHVIILSIYNDFR
jgi:hypothetical protein